jgi:hypothetical protein
MAVKVSPAPKGTIVEEASKGDSSRPSNELKTAKEIPAKSNMPPPDTRQPFDSVFRTPQNLSLNFFKSFEAPGIADWTGRVGPVDTVCNSM